MKRTVHAHYIAAIVETNLKDGLDPNKKRWESNLVVMIYLLWEMYPTSVMAADQDALTLCQIIH